MPMAVRAVCVKVPSEQIGPSELKVARGRGLLEAEAVREGFLEEVAAPGFCRS